MWMAIPLIFKDQYNSRTSSLGKVQLNDTLHYKTTQPYY